MSTNLTELEQAVEAYRAREASITARLEELEAQRVDFERRLDDIEAQAVAAGFVDHPEFARELAVARAENAEMSAGCTD